MAVLAVNGGKAVVDGKLVHTWPPVEQAQRDAVMEVLDSGIFWGPAEKQVTLLQEEIAAYVGAKHALVVNSGTAALHLCDIACGVEPGDEVITTAFSFWATAQGIVAQSAIPVFVDVEPKTFAIDHTKIEEKITEKTKAIIPVHVHGTPAEMDPIMEIARKYNLKVIEDAAQALGAKYKGRNACTLGDMAAISLNGTKNLPAGEGGIVVTDSDELYERARSAGNFGEKKLKKGQYRLYDALTMGFNYRNNEMSDALCRSYLRQYDMMQARRYENVEYLHRELSKIKGINPVIPPDYIQSSYHLYKVILDPAALGVSGISNVRFKWAVEKALRAEGADVYSWHIMPIPGERLFYNKNAFGHGTPWSLFENGREIKYDPYDYPVAMDMFDRALIIRPIYYPNNVELMAQIVEAFKKVLSNVDEVVEFAKTIEVPVATWEKRTL